MSSKGLYNATQSKAFRMCIDHCWDSKIPMTLDQIEKCRNKCVNYYYKRSRQK